jgi:type IV pilus assembly protein PilE
MKMSVWTLSRRTQSGFTLIELMTVVVVVALLLSIAVTSYQSSTRKSRRTEAKTALLDLAGREERLYSTTNQYSSTPSALGYTVSPDSFPLTVGSGYYQIAISNVAAGPPPTFRLTATPLTADQSKDSACTAFILDQTGNQTATGSNSSSCW